ncbi:hypothetical protein M5D96_012674 [Drosophila gunungcola]|uniref:Uncharacterized protein n=1 Tax=Drosophila gunungcola TaxID=103775 RepID=A0A9P9YD70_9MUSC|nr:hypothetical protein M5D96_012674 [Drosophila gunungcola]
MIPMNLLEKLLEWYHNNNVTRDQLDALLKIFEFVKSRSSVGY